MRRLAVAILATLAIQPTLAEDKQGDWITSYYLDPSPERFIAEVRTMTQEGVLKDENAQPPVAVFLGRVMAANPTQVPRWLDEFKDLDETQRTVLWTAAWYSDTEEAREFFRKQQLEGYLKHRSPKILEANVDNPAKLDMLWGYFMATGEEEPIRRSISALGLSKHAGALERFKASERTEQDKKEAYLDVTFQAAKWSLESNCREHPLVLKHCEAIFSDPKLPKDQSLWLGVLLSKVKPENYKVEIGDHKGDEGGADSPVIDPESKGCQKSN